MSTGSMAYRTDEMKLFLAGVRNDDELRPAALTVGINEDALREGDALLSTAQAAIKRQDELQIEWLGLLEEIRDSREALVKTYLNQIRKARLEESIMANLTVRKALELEGERETGVVEQRDQIRRFYETALAREDLQQALFKCGITNTDLKKGIADIAELDEFVMREPLLRGQKESATQAQTKALELMDAWHSHKMTGMEYATQHKPELMKRLRKQK